MQAIHKIKRIRIEKGWSQLELAERSGVPQPTISGIERGDRKYPTYENIKRIAKALEVDIEDLDGNNEARSEEDCNSKE